MPHNEWHFLRGKNSLRSFLVARFSIGITWQMLTVTFGWQMYQLTKSSFYLGLIGLVQFLPMLLLTLVVGYVADRYNRRLIICSCQILTAIGALVLAVASFSGWINKESILFIVFFIGAVNSFQNPTMQALLPNIVEPEVFPQATASSASMFQTAVIIGPALGGLLYVLGPGVVYSIVAVLLLLNSINVFLIKIKNHHTNTESANLKSILGGISFIKSKPNIFGAISLDLFAVLFGGATALLPVYASTILKVGSWGLGLLRSAPALGALIVSAYLSRHPLKNKVGHKMFIAVSIFGCATVVFAVSRSFLLSLIVLAIMGAADVVSVVIRSTLVQLETPDQMRGRVSSVNYLFIGTSNQLGEFESGLTATWFGGVVPAVVVGGLGTLVVVLLWMKMFPGLLNADKFKMLETADY